MWKNWKAVGIAACSGLALSTAAMAQPANDACSSAGSFVIPAAGGTVTGTAASATNDGPNPTCTGVAGGLDVWHQWTPNATGNWRLSLCSSSPTWDSVLTVLSGSCGALTSIACNDDFCGSFGNSQITSTAPVGGTTYLVRVASYDAATPGDAYSLVVTNLAVPGNCCLAGACTLTATGATGCPTGATFTAGAVCTPTNPCPQPPANDNCANAALAPIPAGGGNVLGTTVAATAEAAFNSPGSCDGTGGFDVWHSWTPNDAGPWKLQTCGTVPTWDSVISVHQGCPIDNTNNNQVAGACNDDFCAPLSSIESVSLAAATDYVVRVSSYSSGFAPGAYTLQVINLNAPGNCCIAGACTLTTSGLAGCPFGATFTAGGVCTPTNPCPQPPANDDCLTASVVSSLPFNSGVINIGYATLDQDVACNSTSATGTNNGVWFTYTPASNCTASINHTLIDGINAVFSGTCGGLTELSCSDPATLSYALTGGTQYYFLVGAWSGTALANTATTVVTIDCSATPPPPANDTCPGATVISTLPFSSGAIAVGGATDDIDVACNNTAGTVTRAGIWFTYTPAATCVMQLAETGATDTITSIFTGSCAGGLTEVSCTDLEASTFSAAGGTTYFILVGRWADTSPGVADTYTFTLNCVTPQANDECTSAVALTVGTASSGSLGAATGTDITSCSGSNVDIWYSFAATSGTTYRVTFTPASASDASAGIALFNACPPAVDGDLSCSAQPAPGDPNEVLYTAGASETLFVRLGFFSGNASNFSVIVETITVPAPPANDLCSAATVIPSGPYDSGPVLIFSATNDTNVDPSCDAIAGPVNRGVWWSYTPASNETWFVSSGAIWDTAISIWTGPDCNTLTEVACSDPETFSFTFTGGTTHYILVSFWPNDITDLPPLDAEFQLALFAAPSNDLCANATNLGPSGTATGSTNTGAATNDGVPPPGGSCNGDGGAGLDNSIWFKFTPGSNGQFRVQVETPYDGIVVLYSGADCASLVEITCEDPGLGPDSVDFTQNLVSGTTYYVGIGDWGVTDGGGPTDWTFTFTPDGPTTQNCCRGTTCNSITAGTCTGVVAGSNSLVVTTCGAGNALSTCCFADFNHDGIQSIDDLFLYFNAYFTASPWANVGGDGVATPTIDDLFLYINAYFSTCAP